MKRIVKLFVPLISSCLLLCSCGLFSSSTSEGFFHAKGTCIVDGRGREVVLKGMGMGNAFYQYPETIEDLKNHHDENAYKELSELGFNCVRFLLNYQLFEEDEKPCSWKADGFDWIRENIEWAEKYGIKIILNMHVPQGGYQSNGNGAELWSYEGTAYGNENQKRLCALWTAIAAEFKDSTVIIGYGMVNEPCVIYDGTEGIDIAEEAVKQWQLLASDIAGGIRSVDTNHIIFAEPCSVRDEEKNWVSTEGLNTYPEIEDDNLVYEFHDYNPYYYTHQQSSESLMDRDQVYPDESYSQETYVAWLGQSTDTMFGEEAYDSQWHKAVYEASAAEILEKYADGGIFNVKVTPCCLYDSEKGIDGKLYVDDVSLYRVDQDGVEKLLYTQDFSEEQLWSMGSSDDCGKISWNSEEGHSSSGCLEYSSMSSWGWSSCSTRFNLEENCSYRVELWYRTEGLSSSSGAGNTGLGFDIMQGNIKYGLDYSFLYDSFLENIDCIKSMGKPCFCGEFGCYRACFKENDSGVNRGGCVWVRDAVNIMKDLGTGFSYHAYHEQAFGLHSSDASGAWGSLPSDEDLNDELAETFREILK